MPLTNFKQPVVQSCIMTQDAGAGSTNTQVRNFANVTNIGTDVTGSLSATLGAFVTINVGGVYSVSWNGARFTDGNTCCIKLNSTVFTGTKVEGSTIAYFDLPAANLHTGSSVTRRFNAGDVIRAVYFTANGTAGNQTQTSFEVVKLGP